MRHLARIAGRQDQELAALTAIRPWEPHIAEELAAINRDGTLPEIHKDALQVRRRLEDQRAIPAKIDVAHGIDDIRIGRGH